MMICFLWQRFRPFLFCFLVFVLLSCLGKIFQSFSEMSFSLVSIVAMLGSLLLTSLIAFLYMMLPYLLYLLFLPVRKVASKTDKVVSAVFFFCFVYANLFGVAAEQIFWDEFSSAFNFIAVDYLVYTHEVIENIYQSYPVNCLLVAILLLSTAILVLMRKTLVQIGNGVAFSRRFVGVVGYILLLVGVYHFVDITQLEWGKNRFNNEAGKQGTFSLFSAFLKNEIDYKTFYPLRDAADNMKILTAKFDKNGVKLLQPDKNILREISYAKPEIKANVIIVLMESLSAKYMDMTELSPEGENIKLTPNLNKLASQGLYLSNVYATGTRSVRGIEALTLGVPPLPGMSIVRRNHNENLRSVGSIFAEKGYENKWIYGGFGYFDNMNYFFANNGFEVVDRGTWNKGEVTFANAWGACDEDTYHKLIQEADKSYAKGKPFLSVMLSISNHRPYTYPDENLPLKSGKHKRRGAVLYADYAIGKFIETAKTKPWFDNTVFVFVADHTAGAAGKEEINLEGHHIPAIIYAPKLVKPQRVDMAVSQIDILPTLLGILNFDYVSSFWGQDILKSDYESRFFVSNYQKVGYVKGGTDVILKPLNDFSFEGKEISNEEKDKLLAEGIAFYQQADEWETYLPLPHGNR